MAELRIQKALADAGVASRRAADALVEQGRVTINGQRALVGQRVDPAADVIAVDGRAVGGPARHVYLCLSKPAGVTSTAADRHAERTVLDLVPQHLRQKAGRIYPVGRLDRDSEGLILLTNDGDWAERVLHPRYRVEREYAVALSLPLDREQRRQLETGVELEEGLARLSGLRRQTGAETRKLEEVVGRGRQPFVWYRAILTQGWKRQLRRMFSTVDAPVERLVRIRIGTLWLGNLRPGSVRPLARTERASLEALSRSRRAESGLVVSLDGPGASGKSTVGAGAAAVLRYRFCDTGLLYRALTWLALERGVPLDDGNRLSELIPGIELVADDQGRLRLVHVAGTDVTARVHSPRVDRSVSEVSRQPEVRDGLRPIQRMLAAPGRIIVAGRDIGTVVLPQADLKLYLDVSVEERAERRARERGLDPSGPEADAIRAELRRRDELDTARTIAPLRVPDGARVISSGGNELQETITQVVAAIREAEAARRP